MKTIEFIERSLPAWRDDPTRGESETERVLNSQLCKFLNVTARGEGFAMVHFHHEEPQGVRHASDISANPVDADWIEGRPYSKYEPFLVVECKRLPTPGSGREREYVTSGLDERPAGGIQRFKLGLHARRHRIAGMIGFVQSGGCADWFAEINRWIEALVASNCQGWESSDRLAGLVVENASRMSRSQSEHSRIESSSSRIRLTHLWIEMARTGE